MIALISRHLISLGAIALIAAASPATAAGKREHVRGTITAATADSLTVKTREGGMVKIALPKKLRISGLTKIDLAKVEKGSYIGTAAMAASGGMLTAQEVACFPRKCAASVKATGRGIWRPEAP